MKRRKIITLAGLAVIAGAAAFYYLSNMRDAQADMDPAHLAVVERDTMVRSVVATGKIEPIRKVEIKSKANGIIEVLNVEVGRMVNPGDILAELDKENLSARLREAQANHQAARAALQVAEAELQKNIIEAKGPDVEYYRSTYERAKVLFAQQLIAQHDLDKARADLQLAENRRDAARSALQITRAKISQAQANVAQASAAVERAEEELRNATIRAPIRGTVLTRDVELGSPVSSILNLGAAATLVMTLGDINRVFVRGKVDEADIGHVQMHQPARITVESFRDRDFKGEVTLISPIGVEKDNVTTFMVEVSIDNPGNDLKANMTANAEIVLEEHKNVLIVPLAAVLYDPQKKPYVEVPGAEGKRRVPVRLGIGNGTRTEVLEGLAEGAKVILP
jgi:HlyD family secretion protein